MTNTTLKFEINSLPKELRAEVANFIEFLKSKQNKKSRNKLNAREFGFAKGKISLSPDFDEPLDEFKEYM